MAERLRLAYDTLEALSVGDALGEQFFGLPERVRESIASRSIPAPPWRWTDDTLMAASVVEVVAAGRGHDQDSYAASFASRYEDGRGHGWAVRDLIYAFRAGGHWRRLAAESFGGQGSWGNGAAMRVGPLGAFHAGDPAAAAAAAAGQAVVTHAHAEAVDGAVAVAVAASVCTASRGGPPPAFGSLLGEALLHVAGGRTAEGLRAAIDLGPDVEPEEAAAVLGSGQEIAAFDTVPFALWSAACSPDDFEATFWRTVAGLGDRDTTCAIAAAVVGARVGRAGIPAAWLAAREPLPTWLPPCP